MKRATLFLLSFFATSIYASEDLTIDKIIQTVNAQNHSSVEETLDWIHANHASFFKGFTLMRESRSLQSATPAAPRAIVFGDDATLILTFNGSKDQKNGNSIEAIQFRSEPHPHWEFREITYRDNAAKVSEKNPARCAECHSSAYNPIWEDYDRWPGAYGEDDDAIIDFTAKYAPVTNDNPLIRRHNESRVQIKKFMASKDEHPRYKYLTVREGNKSEVAPYTEKRRSGSDLERPNLLLTKLISVSHGKTISHHLKSRRPACYEQLKHLLVANFFGCGSTIGGDALFREKTKLALNSRKLVKHNQLADHPITGWTHYETNPLHPQRSTLIRYLGVSRNEWNIGFKSNTWSYFLGFDYMKDRILEGVYNDIRSVNTDLPPYKAVLARLYPRYYDDDYSYDYTDDYQDDEGNYYDTESYEKPDTSDIICNYLQKPVSLLSQESLEEACAPDEPAKKPEAVLTLCQSCHTDDRAAPRIPFDNTAQLKEEGWVERIMKRLKTDGDKQMPPSKHLNSVESIAFEKWLSTL